MTERLCGTVRLWSSVCTPRPCAARSALTLQAFTGLMTHMHSLMIGYILMHSCGSRLGDVSLMRYPQSVTVHPQRQCYRLRLHLQPPPPPLPPSPPQQPPPALAHSAAAARACSCAAFASAISAASGSLRDACFSACASASFIDRAVLSLLHHTHTHTPSVRRVCVCCHRKLEDAV